MAENNTKPIIIEFNGLPGSGKSTIAKIVCNSLASKMRVLTHYEEKYIHRYNFTVFSNPKYWRLARLQISYSKLYVNKPHSPLKYSVAPFVREYVDFSENTNNTVLVRDQGVIQEFISLAHCDKIIKSDGLKEIIEECCFEEMNILFVNCMVDVKTSAERIGGRKPNGSRLERMILDERLKALEIQEGNFKVIRTLISSIYPGVKMLDIDTSKEPQVNADLILRRIRGI